MNQIIAFVTGATGHQGGATARELVKSGVKVHALVRDPSSESAIKLQLLGVRLYPGDFDDLLSIKAAMESATAVFLNVSPNPFDPKREVIHAENIINTATASGTVTTIVYSSVAMSGKHESFPGWGPDYPRAWYWQSKARIESTVQKSGIQHWTILRPAFLMNNYHLPTSSFMFPELAHRRVFLSAYNPTTAMTMIDPNDVGKFAAAAIVDPSAFDKHEIDLGVESLTPAEIVQELSRVSGKEIALQFYDENEAKKLGKDDPRLDFQLWTNEVGYQVDFKELEKYPIPLTKFSDCLKKHEDDVLMTFSST